MKHTLRRFLEAIVLVALVAAGGALFSLRINMPFPEAAEGQELLVAAVRAEGLDPAQWPEGVCAQRTLFHEVAGLTAAFVGIGPGPYPSRCYRVVPVVFGVLFLFEFFALGVRRNGGFFETTDGLFWGLAFAAVLFGLVWHGVSFAPAFAEAFLFSGVLLAARSYALWPGYLSAATFGLLCAGMLSLDANALWLLGGMLPAVAIGAGWRRLCLYWRTLHVGLALAICLGTLSILWQFDLLSSPNWPSVRWMAGGWTTWRMWLWRFGWLCGGGFGVVGWTFLSFWCWLRSERRWARLSVIAYPWVLIGTFLFGLEGIFGMALGVFSAITMGMALSAIKRGWMRGWIGALTVVALGFGLGWTPLGRQARWLKRSEQKENFLVLRTALEAPPKRGVRLRMVGADAASAAQMLWAFRAYPGKVVMGEAVVDDADVLVVEDRCLTQVSPLIGRLVQPGVVRTGQERQFRVFAAKKDATEEAL